MLVGYNGISAIGRIVIGEEGSLVREGLPGGRERARVLRRFPGAVATQSPSRLSAPVLSPRATRAYALIVRTYRHATFALIATRARVNTYRDQM